MGVGFFFLMSVGVDVLDQSQPELQYSVFNEGPDKQQMHVFVCMNTYLNIHHVTSSPFYYKRVI